MIVAGKGFSRLLPIVLGAALSACALQPRSAHDSALPWAQARQLVLVTPADWSVSHAALRSYERRGHAWHLVQGPIDVAIGRAGAAWGIGLHPAQAGPVKQEGDGRSPAGVFALGTAFGYAAADATRWPYAALQADDYCVDVSGSPLYNRIVAAHEVGAAAVQESTEPMRRDLHLDGDQRYKLGFVIAHNPNGVAGAGSCIFGHLWKAAGNSTAGCTAMDETAMRALLDWLDPEQQPVFVLLPMAEYRRLSAQWQLPDLAR